MSDQQADILVGREAPQNRSILEVIDTHLATACEHVEAGFYFEEGGCFGMALELHSALCAAGIDAELAVYENNSHALVVVGDHRYDYQGRLFNTAIPIRKVGPAEFLAAVGEAGHSEEDLLGAQEYARAALTVAFELSDTDLLEHEVHDAAIQKPSRSEIKSPAMTDYPDYQVAFNFASDHGHLHKMMAALDEGANIDEQDNVGRTALARAVNLGRWPIADMLLSRGANPDLAENSGFTSLHRMVESMGYNRITETDRLQHLLEACKNVGAVDNSGKTALHVGVACACPLKALDMLLERGLDIDARDKLGRTALHHAARDGAADMIGWLLERGAAEDTIDNDGKTARALATQDGLAAFEAWHAKQAVARVINRSFLASPGEHP